ncbi:mechanosensitive ion channel domain-containing protein [Pseudoxanthomonas sp. UTMC 1351]|uniref:mechanosensitive ion channel domain-containing protein n=1 Tax=Pseudoxanthomonas sp. UTMC 1351 TaxID=2695853 RepID=UPI0034CF2C98
MPSATPAPVPLAPAPPTEAQADRELSRRVGERLRDVDGLEDVTATVHGQVARLDGEVVEPEKREVAEQVATQQPGIETVENRVRISTRLSDRLQVAVRQVGDKLLRLIAAAPLLVVALVIFLTALWLGRLVAGRIHFRRLHQRNPYIDSLVGRVLQWLIVFGGLLMALDLLGATTLVGAALGSAGVVGLVMGFAFKDIAENYVAGILLSLRKPFAPGDHIVVESREGKVVALTSRATVLMTLDGNQLTLPNAMVFKSVMLNYTQNPLRRFDFTVVLGADESIRQSQELALAQIAGVAGVLADPAPSWQIEDYAADKIVLRFYGWVDQRKNDIIKVRTESIHAVKATYQGRAAQTAAAPAPERIGGDTSVNHDIDAQLAAERRAHGERDLLQSKAATEK